jgi:hypothetical protein
VESTTISEFAKFRLQSVFRNFKQNLNLQPNFDWPPNPES